MDFNNGFKQAIGILRFDERVILSVSRDSSADLMSVLFILIGSVLSYIGMFFTSRMSSFAGIFGAQPYGIGGVISTPIGQLIGFAIYILILMGMCRVLGAAPSFSQLFRPIGYVSLLAWVQVIPGIGILFGLIGAVWALIAQVVIIKTICRFNTGRAITAILLPLVILFVFIFVVLASVLALLAVILSK